MCGLVGAIYPPGNGKDAEIPVIRVLERQSNRGPDFSSVTRIENSQFDSVLLGHNRLSITDLSARAHQPMWDATGSHCIVLNGEIYNYLELKEELARLGCDFKTTSDTEVLLNAFKVWGTACLDRLVGSFAFALYSRADHTIWLVRDRFGKAPLYYLERDSRFYFASDPKALALEFGLVPNLNYAVQGVLLWVYETDGDITPYESLHALPAAHYLEIKLRRRPSETRHLVPRRYYNLELAAAVRRERLIESRPDEIVDEMRSLFENAVQIRKRADVPIGIALSGGLDSTTIAAFLRDDEKTILKSYCFGDPKQQHTEGPLVEQFSRCRNIDVQYIWPTPVSLEAFLKSTIELQGAPFNSASIIAQNMIYRAAKQDGISVLLSGQACDEVFMGYRKFQLFKVLELVHRRQSAEAVLSMLGLSKMLWAEGFRLVDYAQHLYRYRGVPAKNATILNGGLGKPFAIDFDPARESMTSRHVRDIVQISLPTLLRYEDRNCFGNGVESRLPFLDYRIVEFGVALADSLKIKNGFGKWIVREIGDGRVPDSIRKARYKRGFDISMDAMFELGFGKMIRRGIRESLSMTKEYVAEPLQIDQHFSDYALKNNKMAFPEAMTLLWLADYTSQLRFPGVVPSLKREYVPRPMPAFLQANPHETIHELTV